MHKISKTGGKLISEDYRVLLKADIQKALQAEFGCLTDFLRRWNSAERKLAAALAHHFSLETEDA